LKVSESLAMVGERILVANLTDVELVIEVERQLSWSSRPSPGDPRAPLSEVLFCNAVVPVVAARLAGRPYRRMPGVAEDTGPIDFSLLHLRNPDADVTPVVGERRRAVASFRRYLSELSDADLASTARFHFGTSRKYIAGRGYDPRLAQIVLPEMIRRVTDRRGSRSRTRR